MNDVKFEEEVTMSEDNRRARLPWDMCLKEARRQARLRDIVRQENICGNASNGDSSGRHDSSFRETGKRHYGAKLFK